MKKTILMLAANPKDTPRLRLDQEVREIDSGLLRARRRDDFILKQLWAPRPIDVRRALLDSQPNIVHFSGHGAGSEGLAFEDETGESHLVDADTLSEFFRLFSDTIECVVLNACYSQVQAVGIAKHIPYVIGMTQEVGDVAAIEFAVAFYDALGAGRHIDFAHRLACNAIKWARVGEEATPILISRGYGPSQQELDGSPMMSFRLTPKLPCLLLLDVSGSMAGVPIDKLNSGLRQFVEDLRSHTHTFELVDLALVTFGSRVEVVRDFAPMAEFNLPKLSAAGLSLMGQAIDMALDLIKQRIQAYREQGVPFYNPIVVLITGSPDRCDHAMNRLHKESSLRRLSVIAVGLEGADMEVLTRISPKGNRTIKLKDLRFSEMFKWVSSSIQATSRSRIGDEPAAVPPPDWQ